MNAGIYTFRNRRNYTAKSSPTVAVKDPYAASEIVLPKVTAQLSLPTRKGTADIRNDNAPEIERMETLSRFYWTADLVVLSDKYALCAKALKNAPKYGFSDYHAALADLVETRRYLGIV